MKPSKNITVIVADDHPLALEGVRSLLGKTSDIKVVGEVQDGGEIKRLVAKLRPQVLLLDLRMPNLSPVELEKWVHKNYPETVTLVFTAHHHVAYLAGMMDAGAAGYLDKKLEGNDLASSIRRAACGEILYDKEQIEQVYRWREDVTTKWESLTKREKEVLQSLAHGLDNETISGTMGVATRTIEFHITNILRKLRVCSRLEAVTWIRDYLPDDLWKPTG